MKKNAPVGVVCYPFVNCSPVDGAFWIDMGWDNFLTASDGSVLFARLDVTVVNHCVRVTCSVRTCVIFVSIIYGELELSVGASMTVVIFACLALMAHSSI